MQMHALKFVVDISEFHFVVPKNDIYTYKL